MKEFITRDMSLDDLPKIAQIESDIFPDPWPESAFGEHLENRNWFARVVENGSGIIAYACFMTVAGEAHLTNIAVIESYRRKSVAKTLMESILEELKKMKCEIIYLEVRQSNQSAISFYDKLNFEELYKRDNYYQNPNEGAVVMSRKIY